MKSVFKIVLNKLRSTFRRSTDQNLNQQQQQQQQYHDQRNDSLQDDSEQSGKIKNSRSDSSLGTCSILLGNSKLSDLIENELKNKGCLPRNKHQSVIRCSSATCSPRRPPLPHPPVKQYGSNKSNRSFGSTLSGKSIKSVGQLNQNEQQTASSSRTSSTTNLNQQQQQEKQQRKNVSCQDSNDTLSTTSSIAMLFNQPTTSSKINIPSSQKQQQFEQFTHKRTGSNTSLLKNDSPGDSSSHLSSMADTVPELPNLNEDDKKVEEKNLSEMDNSISASSPNLFIQSSYSSQQLAQQQSNQPLLISQSMSMDEPDLSDTDSLIGIEIDPNKVRSKSVDASVVIAMKNQNLAVGPGGQKGKARGSTPFLEIPKWRLFVRKQSTSNSTLNVNNVGSLAGTSSCSTSNQDQGQTNTQLPSTPSVTKLTDIFKDCVHCKWLVIIEPQKNICNYNESNDLYSDNNNNIPSLLENQSLEEEDEEEYSDEMDSEEGDCQPSSAGIFNQQTSFFQGNDFSSTAVYHQQVQPTSSIAKDSGVRRYIKNRQRRSSYNVTYYSKPQQSNLQSTNQTPTSRPSSATGFIKKPASSSDKKSDNEQQSENKQPIFRLPSVTLSEASDDEDKDNAINDLISATNQFNCETQFISIQITEPQNYCDEQSELDPGSGITVVSLEVPVLNSGKQARSASVDSSFLQVPQREDVEISGELPPTKSIRSKSVDIALPEGPDGPYLVVPTAQQRPQTTK